LTQLNIRLEALGGAGCPILEGVALKALRRGECIVARDQALKRLSETNLPIIFGQKWDRYNDAMIDYDFETEKNLPSSKDSFAKLQLAVERTLETFVARGHNVLIIGGHRVPRHRRKPLKISWPQLT
jgi:hypothetical protein